MRALTLCSVLSWAALASGLQIPRLRLRAPFSERYPGSYGSSSSLQAGGFGVEDIRLQSGSSCYLVGAVIKRDKYNTAEESWSVTDSLTELGRLSETAGLHVVGKDYQTMQNPLPGTFIGLGKLEEVVTAVNETGAQVLIFDEELSPGQQRNLQKASGVQVIDRTMLILFIFAQRAKTREAKLQVQSAQFRYMLPRLTTFLSVGAGLDAKGGGLGLKGAGETQLEVDRRLFRKQLQKIEEDLATVQTQRDAYRAKRRETDLAPVIAIVGYTNAGKSTLLNKLCGSEEVYADDLLFATLDPTTRRLKLPAGKEVLMSDTVGFVQKLPTRLVSSFRATLDELCDAAVVVHAVDCSSPLAEQQVRSVQKIVLELGAQDTPQILLLNKADAVSKKPDIDWAAISDPVKLFSVIPASARDGRGLDRLLATIEKALIAQSVRIDCLLPFSEGALVTEVHSKGTILSESFTESGTRLGAYVPLSLRNRIEKVATQFRAET